MNSGRKILVVSQSFFPAIGGVSSFLAALTYGLAKLGYDVHALHFRVSDSDFLKDSIPGVRQHEIDANSEFSAATLKQYAEFKEDLYRKLHGLDAAGVGDIRMIQGYQAFRKVAAIFSRRALSIMRENKIDILNVHDYQLFPMLTMDSPVKKVFNVHTPVLSVYPVETVNFVRRIVAKADQAVVSIPDYLATLVGDGPPSRLTCIPPFINHVLQEKLAAMKMKEVDDIVIPDSPFVVVCAQRFDSKSGHQQLIRGFARFLEEAPEALLVLVGGASFTDSIADVRHRYYQEARELTSALGIESSVLFVGPVPYQHIGMIYDRAHVFCMLSKSECFGLALTEAMLRKVPAVVTRVGGLRYQIREGLDGITVEVDDSAAVTNALKILRENPHLRARYSESAHRRYLDLFHPEEIMRRYCALFQSL